MWIAVGDLFVEIDVPDGYEISYEPSGALVAAALDHEIRVSAWRGVPKNAAEEWARRNRGEPERYAEGFHLHRGLGNRVLISSWRWLGGNRDEATAVRRVRALLSTARLTHEPRDVEPERQLIREIAPSQRPWLGDRTRLLLRAIEARLGRPQRTLPSGETLDEYWTALVENPPEGDALGAQLAGLGVCLGELLIESHGFEWCVVTDSWGSDLGVVSDRGRSDTTVVPTAFVAKRWERREGVFFEHALSEICAARDRFREAFSKP